MNNDTSIRWYCAPRNVYRNIMLAAAGFFALFAVGTCAYWIARPDKLPAALAVSFLVVFGGFAFAAARFALFRKLYDIGVDEAGLYSRIGDRIDHLPWRDVRSWREETTQQRLQLFGPPGAPTILVRYHLEEINDLRRIIFERLPRGNISEFRRTKADFIGFGITTVFLFGIVVSSATIGKPQLAKIGWVVFGAMGIVGLFVTLRTIRAVSVRDDAVYVRRWAWPGQVIPYGEIVSLEHRMDAVSGDAGVMQIPDVVIKLRNGGKVAIDRVVEGAAELYAAIRLRVGDKALPPPAAITDDDDSED